MRSDVQFVRLQIPNKDEEFLTLRCYNPKGNGHINWTNLGTITYLK